MLRPCDTGFDGLLYAFAGLSEQHCCSAVPPPPPPRPLQLYLFAPKYMSAARKLFSGTPAGLRVLLNGVNHTRSCGRLGSSGLAQN